MEKSIKRVEKLVHVTNSALAQMKFSLMFDDMTGDGDGKSHHSRKPSDPALLDKLLDGDDLKLCQKEFKSEAEEMLAKVESLYPSNESNKNNSKALERIKEINKRMNCLRLEQPEETQQSRQKLLDLINEEKFSSGFTSSWDSVQSKHNREKKPSERSQPAPKKTDSSLTLEKSPTKSREELKNKILETQDIVNRGFQTARQLAQKVETISKCERKEMTPTDVSKRGSEGKAETNDSDSTHKCKKCAKRRRGRKEVEDERVNSRVIDIKVKEVQKCRKSNLQVQRLPSLNIRGSLQLQKILDLEIPAGGDASCGRSNTAVNFLSHEEIQNEKMSAAVGKVRKENCCCTTNNYVECFNCGKLIRMRETVVDPRKVDEVLERCNFDVFDPRIDEFVEKCGTGAVVTSCKDTQTPDENATAVVPQTPIKDAKKEDANPKKSWHKLQGFSDQLLKKYKQETESIESNHVKLDNILQKLFRQVDESREVFEKCHLFSSRSEWPKLTVTKPVVVSVTETSSKGRRKYRKLHKHENRSWDDSGKSKTVHKGDPIKSIPEQASQGVISLSYANPSENAEEIPGRFPASSGHSLSEKTGGAESSSTSVSCGSGHSKHTKKVEKTPEIPSVQHGQAKAWDNTFNRKDKTQRDSTSNKKNNKQSSDLQKDKVEEDKPVPEASSPHSNSKRTDKVDNQKPKSEITLPSLTSKFSFSRKDETEVKPPSTPSSKSERKTPSESSSDKSEKYESDFESTTNEPNEDEEEERESNADVNKLSTISEVDSELEKKLSDEQRAARSGRKSSRTLEMSATDRHDLPKQKENVAENKQADATSPKTAESTPTELVTSLKDILSALQDQFLRTESLAEKLTENVKSEGKVESGVTLRGDAVLNTWKTPIGVELVENLRSARKDLRRGPNSPRRSTSGRSRKTVEEKEDSLSDEGGSSLGEIILSDRRRKTSGKSESSSISECSFLRLDSVRKSARVASSRREVNPDFKLGADNEEVLYSEGEIPSDEFFASDCLRSGSLGEVQ